MESDQHAPPHMQPQRKSGPQMKAAFHSLSQAASVPRDTVACHLDGDSQPSTKGDLPQSSLREPRRPLSLSEPHTAYNRQPLSPRPQRPRPPSWTDADVADDWNNGPGSKLEPTGQDLLNVKTKSVQFDDDRAVVVPYEHKTRDAEPLAAMAPAPGTSVSSASSVSVASPRALRPVFKASDVQSSAGVVAISPRVPPREEAVRELNEVKPRSGCSVLLLACLTLAQSLCSRLFACSPADAPRACHLSRRTCLQMQSGIGSLMGNMEKLMQSYPLDVSDGVLTSPLVRPQVQCASQIILCQFFISLNAQKGRQFEFTQIHLHCSP